MKKKMNLLQLITVSILTVVLAGLVGCGLTSCKSATFPWSKESKPLEEVVDSIAQLNIQQTLNPLFTTAEEAIVYRDLTEEEKKIDSIFNSLPNPTLTYVANVVIGQYGAARKKCIVEEYLKHPDIYDNLPVNTPTASKEDSKQDPASTEDSGVGKDRKLVISTKYNYRTDTVDGQPVRVETKTEESYVSD